MTGLVRSVGVSALVSVALWAPTVEAATDGGDPASDEAVAAPASPSSSATNRAAWAPVRGNREILCTQGNPGWRGCANRHRKPAIDIRVPVGTPVYAAGDGVVHESRYSPADGRGHFVAIRHPDGVYSRYLHLSKRRVGRRDRVVAGQLIGFSGTSGRSSIPHLHYDEQKPYDRSVPIGTMYAVHGNRRVAYPGHLGRGSWRSVPYGSRLINHRLPYRCDGRYATHQGTPGADWLRGTNRSDVLVSFSGHDIVAGLGGHDRICSGRGNDLVGAGGGRDRVWAGYGRDLVTGDPGDDLIDAGPDADRVTGGRGRDWIVGSSGSDPQLAGEAGDDLIVGSSGNDRLSGGGGTDDCDGGSGRDRADTCERRTRIP